MTSPGLRVESLRKEYPGTVALDGASLSFRPGAVHAVIGKNGAGKSTLVKVLSGAVRPTSGRVLLDGREITLRSPSDAIAEGIATVYQEMSLVPALSVAENILLGRMPRRRILGLPVVDWEEARARSASLLEGLGAAMDVRLPVSRLDVARQQEVEIAKAMSRRPRVLLLDEPTSALSQEGARSLFRLVRELRSREVAVLYITHRLQELREIADEVSALRDGRLAGTLPASEATPSAIARMMFGEAVGRSAPATRAATGETVLEVRNVTLRGRLHGVSLRVGSGEIVGIAGTLGAGRTELLRAIFGAGPMDAGEVIVAGRTVRHPRPPLMKRLGLGLVPEDRKREGLVLPLSVRDNLSLASLGRISRGGLVRPALQEAQARRSIRDLEIAVADSRQPVSSLSGGNQQKVVLGKWLNTEPRVILFDEPTRGVDVQARRQIFALLRGLAARGIASLFVSTELEELLEVCQRVLVLRGGRIAAELPAEGLGVERLLAACLEG